MKLREVVPVTPQEAATVEVVWRRRGRRRVGAVAVLVVGAVLLSVLPFREHHQRFLAQQPVLVVAADGADVWIDLLRSSGVVAEVGSVDLDRRDLIVVPADAELEDDEVAQLTGWVREGGVVVTPHDALLSGLSSTVPASSGDEPVAERSTFGDGRVLALGWDPAEGDGAGMTALPSLARDIDDVAGRLPVVERDGVELFFDPALATLRYGPLDIETTADRLSVARRVHIAGWYDGSDAASTFDYDALVDALHERGVLAGLWLAPPHVSSGMWQRHPECREKRATGEDSTLGWRQAIALEDPACFELAWSEVWSPVLGAAEWDAINVTDLAFEASDRATPDSGTPYHPTAVAQLAADVGGDRDAARVAMLTQIADTMLGRIIDSVDRTKALGLTLTVPVDGETADARRRGVDLDALVAVADAHGASVVVDSGASRASSVGATTRIAVTDGLAGPTDAAMLRAPLGGVALSQRVAADGARDGRVSVYGFGALEDIDLAGLPRALAADVAVDGTTVDSQYPVQVRSPHPDWLDLRVDGEPYPANGDLAIIPAGRHRVEWRPGDATGRPALVRTSVRLLEADAAATSMQLRYEAAGRAFVVLDRRPVRISVDDVRQDLPVRSSEHGFVVEVPDGRRILRFEFTA